MLLGYLCNILLCQFCTTQLVMYQGKGWVVAPRYLGCIEGLLTKCEVKMVGYWPSSFFCESMDQDLLEVHKLAKSE